MVDTLGQVVTITLAADAGGAIGIAIDRQPKARLHRLVWLAGGAMLAVTGLDMLPEAEFRLGPLPFVLAALAGGSLIAWMARRFPSVCPACDLAHGGVGAGSEPAGAWLITLALAVHCTLDGIGLAASDRLPASHALGVFVGMSLHKLPEGLALALLLLGAGMRREVALAWTLLAESFTLVGALCVIWLGPRVDVPGLAALVAFVGGGFLVLVLRFLADSGRTGEDKGSAVRWALFGFLATALISALSA